MGWVRVGRGSVGWGRAGCTVGRGRTVTVGASYLYPKKKISPAARHVGKACVMEVRCLL